jgi:hypothetical protein
MVNASQCKAINIALLPDHRGSSIAIKFNNYLRNKSDKCFRFDHAHHPHTTLFQLFIRDEYIDQLLEQVEAHVNQFRNLQSTTVKINKLEKGSNFGDDKNEAYLPSLDISDPGSKIKTMHEIIASNIVKEFVVKSVEGDASQCFFSGGESVTDKSIEYVKTFHLDHAHDNYGAHMSVGIGSEADVDELVNNQQEYLPEPTAMSFDKVVVAHLGNYCTCSQIIQGFDIK